MTERRETTRRRVCFGGLVRTAAFLPELPCTLRDVSLAGALIRLPDAPPLPARIDLVVPCRGEMRRARVVWRAGTSAGLAFEADAPVQEPAEILRRLVKSEAEVARLRAALAAEAGAAARLH